MREKKDWILTGRKVLYSRSRVKDFWVDVFRLEIKIKNLLFFNLIVF